MATQDSVRPDAHADPIVLDVVSVPAAMPDFVHTARIVQLQHRAEAAEVQAAAAEEARSVAEEALQRMSDCDARLPTDNVHVQRWMASQSCSMDDHVMLSLLKTARWIGMQGISRHLAGSRDGSSSAAGSGGAGRNDSSS